MRVLIACEYSGTVRDAFIRAGHDAMSCDLLPTDAPGPHYQGDVREVIGGGWDMMIAHPECTRLTNAGVRWLKVPPPGKTLAQMWADLFAGAEFYKMLRDAPIPLKAIENPIMHCHARELIKPLNRQIVQPWWFGDEAFKATGFELVGLPELVATNKLTPPKSGTEEHKAWSAIHRASPGPLRWKFRSKTFNGIADAMAAQWGRA
ncbi:Conserved hypothetical protein [Herminiimonas arsenicoxydans]|uniref:Uncharacterized protein n=1 Tax=Herminiimonas arsenicoxydans TaxID=204773 RepID=A4G7D9_HERAR|nr:Conserved hypothetical protein [Herminiimonas arsenicoxydans]